MSSAASAPLSLDALPPALLARCIEYTAAPEDPQLHFYRHIDLPAVYRNATYLWTDLELRNLNKAFAPGWLNDPTHPFQECSGQVRVLSRPRRLSAEGRAAKATEEAFGAVQILDETFMSTVKDQMARASARSPPFIMSDVSPYRTLASSARFLWLHGGPQLFQPFNLLAATPSDEAEHDHTLVQINIGKQGTHTNTHTDWYGADGAAYLTEGEKLWLMAPPHHAAAFNTLFPQTKHFNLAPTDTDPNVAQRLQDLYALSGSCAVHQRTGDFIYVPGGWPHAVINLTDAVSVGWSYLRPWKLKGCLEWAQQFGEEATASVVDLAQVFEKTLAAAVPPSIAINPAPQLTFWGLSPTMLQELRSAWYELKQSWRAGKSAAVAQQTLALTLAQLRQTPIQPPLTQSAASAASAASAVSAAKK